MKMIVIQELAPGEQMSRVLELFAEHGTPEETEELYVSADGRHVFVIGDFDDITEFHRLSELYQPVYARPAQFFPVLSAEVAVPHTAAGIAARAD